MASERKRHSGGIRTFKGETVFDWDAEPSDERPSEFVVSTMQSTYWGASTGMGDSTVEARRRRARRRRGPLSNVWIVIAILVAVATAVIVGSVHWLHEHPFIFSAKS